MACSGTKSSAPGEGGRSMKEDERLHGGGEIYASTCGRQLDEEEKNKVRNVSQETLSSKAPLKDCDPQSPKLHQFALYTIQHGFW